MAGHYGLTVHGACRTGLTAAHYGRNSRAPINATWYHWAQAMVRCNASALQPLSDFPDPIEIGVLEACREVVIRQQEVVPLLAAVMGVSASDVFYTWMSGRHEGPGRIGESGWSERFHGFECDLRHADGRFLRVDFGPKGRLDTFTMWGVLQFIMTSAPPWLEFADLKGYFAEKEPPLNELSGSFSRIRAIWDMLEARGAFEPADPELVEFTARYTAVEADGRTWLRLPPDTPNEVLLDCLVAQRQVLSATGHQLLASARGSGSASLTA